MEKQGVIYKVENLVNGKVYIGQTLRTFKERKLQHITELKGGYKRNSKFQNAWNKYGEQNFTFNIIKYFPVSKLDEKEIYYIEKYDSFKNGYNMTTGGNQVMHNQKHTKKARNKISCSLKARWSDKIFIEKMKKRPVYYGKKSSHATKVICINDQKIFDTLTEAGEYYGIGLKKVSSNCTGKCKYTGLEETGRKLQFSYYKEGKKYCLNKFNNCNEKKKVKCITTGEIFDSMCAASKATGTYIASISHACHGERKHAGKLPDGTKLKWSYYEDFKALDK